MPRFTPLDHDQPGAAGVALGLAKDRLGFVPNSLRIMARKPEIMAAFSNLAHAVWAPGSISVELKGLIAHITSRAATCDYCTAHTAGMALNRDAAEEKIEQIWEYETSPLFSEPERAALRVAQLAGQVPNHVSDADFDALTDHFGEEQIAEIVAVISIFGFLNRWNDTMATPLDEGPMDIGEKHLAGWGWSAGKHVA